MAQAHLCQWVGDTSAFAIASTCLLGTVRLFNLYIRVPYLILAFLEFGICLIALYAAVYVRFAGDATNIAESFRTPFLTSMFFASVMVISMGSIGLYQPRFRGGATGMLLRLLLSLLLGATVLALGFYVFPDVYLGRGAIALATVFSFFIIGTIRPVFFHYVDQDNLKSRVLVLGTGQRADELDARLRRKVDRRGFHVVAYLGVENSGTLNLKSANETVRLHYNESLLQICQRLHIDKVVVAVDERRQSLPEHDLLQCKLHGVLVVDLLDFFEREVGFLPLNLVSAGWMIYSDGFDQGALRTVTKRVVDISLSLLMFLLTWPLMLVAVMAMMIEDRGRGSVFYRQVRVGQFGQTFEVLKFRSMSENAEANGAQWADANDVRITATGRWMRRTRIDELPQLLNVLRGDMSIVGPRPERPEFVEPLIKEVPFYQERHLVKPGIAGWAQLCYPYGSSVDDARKKQEFDLYYVKNHNLFLDLLIIVQTLEVVLFGNGAR